LQRLLWCVTWMCVLCHLTSHLYRYVRLCMRAPHGAPRRSRSDLLCVPTLRECLCDAAYNIIRMYSVQLCVWHSASPVSPRPATVAVCGAAAAHTYGRHTQRLRHNIGYPHREEALITVTDGSHIKTARRERTCGSSDASVIDSHRSRHPGRAATPTRPRFPELTRAWHPMLRFAFRAPRLYAATRAQRLLCTATGNSEHEPLLPRWGSFGKSEEEIATLVEQVQEDGEHTVAVTRAFAELGLKMQAMLTQPMSWFGNADFRAGWLETAAEPLERYSRVNERLLDGCEEAYYAIATEFHRAQPDLSLFIESGAIEPELATMLEEALQKYAAAGRRPALELGRANGQVRMCRRSDPRLPFPLLDRIRQRSPLTALPSLQHSLTHSPPHHRCCLSIRMPSRVTWWPRWCFARESCGRQSSPMRRSSPWWTRRALLRTTRHQARVWVRRRWMRRERLGMDLASRTVCSCGRSPPRCRPLLHTFSGSRHT
jgi:hypothetical protein